MSGENQDLCHWVKDGRRRAFIPGCWGAVLHGPEGCTCRNGRGLHERIAALERRVALLERRKP